MNVIIQKLRGLWHLIVGSCRIRTPFLETEKPRVGRCVRSANLSWRQNLRTRLIFAVAPHRTAFLQPCERCDGLALCSLVHHGGAGRRRKELMVNTKFVLRRTVVVLAIALALGSSALSPNHSRPVAAWNAAMLPPTPMPAAAIALVKAVTSGIPGAAGTPITDLRLHASP